MASLIAGQGGGQSGWVGVAPEAKILPIDVNMGGDEGPKAIRYAVDRGAKVIGIFQGSASTSWPNQCPPDYLDAMTYAARHDVIIMAAAGDHGDAPNTPEYPASCPGAVAVGAFARNGDPWASTARQDYVTVGGPGVDVGAVGKDGRLYHNGNGTGQATAIASASVALLRAKFPYESARQIVQRVIATATDLGPPGKDDTTGYGAVSLRKAMTAIVPPNAPNPVYDRLDKVLAAQAKDSGSDGSRPEQADKKNPSLSIPPVLVVGGGILFVILVIVLILVARNRRGGPPSPGQGFGPPDHARRPGEGPPPPFGPPQYPDPYNQGPYNQGPYGQGPVGGPGTPPYQDPPPGRPWP
jgi:hypothetical protein